MAVLPPSFFARPADAVAADLIGCTLLVRDAGGLIVETEAYRADDPASHSHRGETRSNRSMFRGPGFVYVYRSYGIHWCLNVVCMPGDAVLLRALEPVKGLNAMEMRRRRTDVNALCSGPGKLAQALGVTGEDDGKTFDGTEFSIFARAELDENRPKIMAGPRIGISRAVDRPWRFGFEGSRYLSRPFRP